MYLRVLHDDKIMEEVTEKISKEYKRRIRKVAGNKNKQRKYH